jgi:hypothetical protein
MVRSFGEFGEGRFHASRHTHPVQKYPDTKPHTKSANSVLVAHHIEAAIVDTQTSYVTLQLIEYCSITVA